MNKSIILDFRGKRTEIIFTDNIQGITIVGFGDGWNGGKLHDTITIQERNQIILAIMNSRIN